MPAHKPLPFFWLSLLIVFGVALLRPGVDAASPSATKTTPDSSQLSFHKTGGGDIPMPVDTPAAHASNLVALSPQHPSSVAAFWFAGERESAPDVRIAFSSFDRSKHNWSTAHFVVDRHELGQQLGFGVRRLGNPVAWMDTNDRLHLFVVATGLGGWAAARIVHLEQLGNPYALDQINFAARAVLPLSWLWNTSYLVRNAPHLLADGGMVLPVYFELGTKYPVFARFSRQGEFKGMTRISARQNLLQPTLVSVSDVHWLAYMRMSGGTQHIAVAETLDAGIHWQDLPDLDLPNPNAAVATLGLENGFMLAFNPAINSRSTLSLAQSFDGISWSTMTDLEHGHLQEEFSYPSLVWADEALWASYTNRREKISWQRFERIKARD